MVLYHLAVKYMCIPAGSPRLESFFSVVKDTVTDTRSRLSLRKREALSILRFYLNSNHPYSSLL